MNFENLHIDDDDNKVDELDVEDLDLTISYIEQLMAKRPLMMCKLEQYLNKLRRMVVRENGGIRNLDAKKKVDALFYQFATLRFDSSVEKEDDAEKSERRRRKMIEETSRSDFDWGAVPDHSPRVLTLKSIPPMPPVLDPPELLSYDQVQLRIDKGFKRIEASNIK